MRPSSSVGQASRKIVLNWCYIKVDNNPANTLFYHSNHLGSTAALTDNNGLKAQSYLYHPYGEMWVVEDGEILDEVTRLFTGQEYDKKSGLYYMNARYYDPDLGVFLRPDPAMDGLNHYAYCGGNPVMYNDPTGCETEENKANWGIIDWIVGTIISIVANIVSAARGNGFAGYSSTIVGALDLLTNALSDGAVDIPDQITDQFRTSTIFMFSTGTGDPYSYNYEPSNPFEKEDSNFELFFQTFKPGTNESTIQEEVKQDGFEHSSRMPSKSDIQDLKNIKYEETWYADSVEIYYGFEFKIGRDGMLVIKGHAEVTFTSDKGDMFQQEYSIEITASDNVGLSIGFNFLKIGAFKTYNKLMTQKEVADDYAGVFISSGASSTLSGYSFKSYKNGKFSGWRGVSFGFPIGKGFSGGYYTAVYKRYGKGFVIKDRIGRKGYYF